MRSIISVAGIMDQSDFISAEAFLQGIELQKLKMAARLGRDLYTRGLLYEEQEKLDKNYYYGNPEMVRIVLSLRVEPRVQIVVNKITEGVT